MATGFIYVVQSLTREYLQQNFCNVPTELGNRLYFGPCKIPMRPRMQPGDIIFGISPARLAPRRIVFVSQIEERVTFAEAYQRFPDLRGPEGPIHVRPINGDGQFPFDSYEHIEGAMHSHKWVADLRTPDLDVFFICQKRDHWRGRWLGAIGPEIDGQILTFLQGCSVYGSVGKLNDKNPNATQMNPVCHGRLYTGLHLETDNPELLLKFCGFRISPETITPEKSKSSYRPVASSTCAKSSHRKGCF